MRRILVRRTPAHAVTVSFKVENVENGVSAVIRSIKAHTGPLPPSTASLVGLRFASLRGLRAAVAAELAKEG